MSELSTVAIKDGHRGHPHHHSHRQQTSAPDNTDAERADRISRLAGLERVQTLRQSSAASMPAGASASHPQGYFDPPTAQGNMNKERSTVGSASATGSVGGRTTWASEGDANEANDKMSDQDMDASSTGGFSDEGNASLVGFGEGASSTVSGPTSTAGTRIGQRPGQVSRGSAVGNIARESSSVPMSGVTHTGVGLASSSGGEGATAAERILRHNFDASSGGAMGRPGERQDGQKELGKFSFEESK